MDKDSRADNSTQHNNIADTFTLKRYASEAVNMLFNSCCANFMNQEAINVTLSKINEELGEELYPMNVCKCVECDAGLNLEPISSLVSSIKIIANIEKLHRACYIPKTQGSNKNKSIKEE